MIGEGLKMVWGRSEDGQNRFGFKNDISTVIIFQHSCTSLKDRVLRS